MPRPRALYCQRQLKTIYYSYIYAAQGYITNKKVNIIHANHVTYLMAAVLPGAAVDDDGGSSTPLAVEEDATYRGRGGSQPIAGIRKTLQSCKGRGQYAHVHVHHVTS